MANLLNRAECGLGYALNKLLTEYNMKPILTRPQHRFYTDGRSYFETDLDVHTFSYICRRGLGMMKYADDIFDAHVQQFDRSMLSKMIWDVGVTIVARKRHSTFAS